MWAPPCALRLTILGQIGFNIFALTITCRHCTGPLIYLGRMSSDFWQRARHVSNLLYLVLQVP